MSEQWALTSLPCAVDSGFLALLPNLERETFAMICTADFPQYPQELTHDETVRR